MFQKSSPWVAILLLLLSNTALSLGLGDIKLKSSLNQPLNAEITLLSAGNLDKTQLLVTLASEDAFRNAGVEHLFFLRKIKFTPVFRENGSVIIKLSTKNSIKEPFLDFLIEVNWPNGRIMREYTLLLDPPAFSEVEMGSAPEMAATTSNNNFQPQQVDTNTIEEDNWSGDDADIDVSSGGDYRVAKADTLWGIASKNRTSNASIHQTMMSIFNANPSAFMNDNMNQLKLGSVLTLDGSGNLTQQQALLEIARQNQQWGGSRAQADAVLDTAAYASNSSSSTNSEPRLKLAAAGDGNIGASSSLDTEAIATLSDENDSLRTRLDDQLERNEKLERLLELQNSELAAVGSNQDATGTDDFQLGDDETTLILDESIDGEELIGETEVSTLNSENPLDENDPLAAAIESDTGLADSSDEITTETVAEVATEAETERAAKETVNKAPAIIPKEESFLDSILNLGSMVWAAIISGVLILFFSFLWVRRQNMAEEDFQESLVFPVSGDFDESELPDVGDDILAAEMKVNPDYIPESDVDILDDDAVDIETNADPLGEADVYLAYGKFDQAERILRDALEVEPERLDLRLKIMECFAETKSLSEFKDQKREILEVLATDDGIAEQVKLMERQAWPEEGGKADEIPSTEDIFGDLSFNEGATADENDEVTFPDDSDDADISLSSGDDAEVDSALDFGAANSSDDEPVSNFHADEFIEEDIDIESDTDDLNFISNTTDSAEELAEESMDFISESELMDSDLDDDVLAELDDEPVDDAILDLGDVDEASTKLDLARAYIDMEDFDGASEILQEVMTEGSDTQKGEAEQLLEKMS